MLTVSTTATGEAVLGTAMPAAKMGPQPVGISAKTGHKIWEIRTEEQHYAFLRDPDGNKVEAVCHRAE